MGHSCAIPKGKGKKQYGQPVNGLVPAEQNKVPEAAFAKNGVPLSHARSAFAQLITAAAIGNEGEVRSWLTPERVALWQKIYGRTKGSPKGEEGACLF